MSENAPIAIGAALIGLPTGDIVQGMIRESVDHEPTAEIEYGKDEENNDAYAIISNRGARKSIAGKITGAIDFKKGDSITIDEEDYVIETATISHTPSFTRFVLVVYKPDAMSIDPVTHANLPD